MAQFPSLVPSQAPITPGRWPMATHQAMDGGRTNVRTGSAEIGRAWAPTFENITESDYLAILGHYRAHRTRFDRFDFGTASLAAALTPSGYSWRWAEAPQVVDRHADVFTVSCSFICVPRQMPVISRKAWRTGATTLTRGAWAPTSGAFETGLQFASAATTLGRGAWAGSRAFLDGIPWVSSATTLASGAWSNVVPDANFSSVQLLLPCEGSNGSTTFIDASSAARTVTANGNAQISTARSKWGSASALFDGSGDYLSTSISGGLGSGAFTLEFWFYRTSSSGMLFNSRSGGSGADGFDVFADGRVSTASLWIFGDSAVTSIQNNTWTHFAVTRDGSNVMRRFFDGTQVGSSTTVTNNFNNATTQIGGSTTLNPGSLNGNLDDIRITIGVARYTANFTAPTAAFPTA